MPMNASTHRDGPLSYVMVEPDRYERGKCPLVVLLHGFGANMNDLVSLAPAIDAQSYVYAFPNAPYPVDFGGGAVGYSWALGRPGVITPESVTEPNQGAEERLDEFLKEVMET